MGTKDKHIDPWDRIQSPEISTCIYGQFIYDKWGEIVTEIVTVMCRTQSGENHQY